MPSSAHSDDRRDLPAGRVDGGAVHTAGEISGTRVGPLFSRSVKNALSLLSISSES